MRNPNERSELEFIFIAIRMQFSRFLFVRDWRDRISMHLKSSQFHRFPLSLFLSLPLSSSLCVSISCDVNAMTLSVVIGKFAQCILRNLMQAVTRFQRQKTRIENNMFCQTTNARVGSAAAPWIVAPIMRMKNHFRLSQWAASRPPHVLYVFQLAVILRPTIIIIFLVCEMLKVFRTATFFATSHVKGFIYWLPPSEC